MTATPSSFFDFLRFGERPKDAPTVLQMMLDALVSGDRAGVSQPFKSLSYALAAWLGVTIPSLSRAAPREPHRSAQAFMAPTFGASPSSPQPAFVAADVCSAPRPPLPPKFDFWIAVLGVEGAYEHAKHEQTMGAEIMASSFYEGLAGRGIHRRPTLEQISKALDERVAYMTRRMEEAGHAVSKPDVSPPPRSPASSSSTTAESRLASAREPTPAPC